MATTAKLFWILSSLQMVVSPNLERDLHPEATQSSPGSVKGTDGGHTIEVEERNSFHGESARLPGHVTPYSYDITLKLHMSAIVPSFEGAVNIVIACQTTTKSVRLNTRKLRLANLRLWKTDTNQPVLIEKLEEIADLEQLVIHLYTSLSAGVNYTIHAAYHADMVFPFNGEGLYWDAYVEDGRFKHLAVTQFSPTGARCVFPSFDEPRFKATFKISVWHRTGTTALSNMPVENTQRLGSWCLDRFMKTPVMSTYLVAIAVTAYDHKEYEREDGTLIRVWARKDLLPHMSYALELTHQLMSYFENYTQVKYDLPKIDILCVPDHPVRAMENWGLMIYQEMALTWQAESMPSSHYSEWLGNLITPRWWDELWLKEGFATFFMYEAAGAIYPHWHVDHLFLWNTMHSVMTLDNSLRATPVISQVELPSEIQNSFTQQVYSKGACIVLILKSIFGEDVFKGAIRNLINKHKYDTVTTMDLWQSFRDVLPNHRYVGSLSADVIFRFMDVWLRQPGYPYVEVDWNGDDEMRLKQKRFVDKLTPSEEQGDLVDGMNYNWPIPLNLSVLRMDTGENLLQVFHWMTNAEEEAIISHNLPAVRTVLVTNTGDSGFYRATYSNNSFVDIVYLLRTHHEAIPLQTRARLIDDVFMFSRNYYAVEVLPFTLIQYLENEMDDLPWHVTLNNIKYTASVLSHTEMARYFKKMSIQLMKRKYDNLGWQVRENESILRRMVRQELLRRICEFGYEPCLEHTRVEFEKWRRTPNYSLQPDVRGTILCYGIHQGTADDWMYLYNSSEGLPYHIQNEYMEALSCTQNVTLLNRFLGEILVDYQDLEISNIAKTKVGKETAWQFLEVVWRNTSQRMNYGSFLLKLASSFINTKELKQLDDFIESVPDDPFSALYAVSRQLVVENISWMRKNQPSLLEWFREHQQFVSSSTQPVVGVCVSAVMATVLVRLALC